MISNNEEFEISTYISELKEPDEFSEVVTNILDHLDRFGDISKKQDTVLVSYLLNTVRANDETNN